MGEGEGGGEQDEDPLVPPPHHPLPPWAGENLRGEQKGVICFYSDREFEKAVIGCFADKNWLPKFQDRY